MLNIIMFFVGCTLLLISESIFQYEADRYDEPDTTGVTFGIVLGLFGFCISIISLLTW